MNSKRGAARTYILLAILVLVVIGGAAWWNAKQHKPGDLQYYKDLQNILYNYDRSKPVDFSQILKRIEALPVADVTDPKLLELQQKQIEFFKLKIANPGSDATKAAYVALQHLKLEIDDDYGNVK